MLFPQSEQGKVKQDVESERWAALAELMVTSCCEGPVALVVMVLICHCLICNSGFITDVCLQKKHSMHRVHPTHVSGVPWGLVEGGHCICRPLSFASPPLRADCKLSCSLRGQSSRQNCCVKLISSVFCLTSNSALGTCDLSEDPEDHLCIYHPIALGHVMLRIPQLGAEGPNCLVAPPLHLLFPIPCAIPPLCSLLMVLLWFLLAFFSSLNSPCFSSSHLWLPMA